MRWGWCGCAVESFSAACGRGSRGSQCLERRAERGGRASENRCPGRAILPPIPQLLRQIRLTASAKFPRDTPVNRQKTSRFCVFRSTRAGGKCDKTSTRMKFGGVRMCDKNNCDEMCARRSPGSFSSYPSPPQRFKGLSSFHHESYAV
jgi:hypothetical protein